MKILSNPEKVFVDIFSVLTGLGALVKLLPEIAALLTIVWTCIRIYETETVQRLFKKRKKKEEDKDSG